MKDKAKNTIKALLSVNTFSNAFFYGKAGARNREHLESLLVELSSQDYLNDVYPLKEFQERVRKEGSVISTFDVNWSNTHIYGIWQGIFGQECLAQKLFLPAVEHGLILHDDVFTDLRTTARHTIVTFSEFRKKIIQRIIHRPVFCLGPYTHYCTGFYSDERLEKEKKKFGKTLLVFPTHSTDTSELSIDQMHFINNLSNIVKEYDSVLINAFWWNINDPLIKQLEREGYKIISCGFRDDPMFLQRLKSYIQLSDFCIGDSIGTHVGYCVDAGVPFSYQNVGTNVILLKAEEKKTERYKKIQIEKIQSVFDNAVDINSEIMDIYNYYWGGNQIKSEGEIQAIKEISEELTKMDLGFTGRSNANANKLLKKYNSEQPEKYRLLKEAL